VRARTAVASTQRRARDERAIDDDDGRERANDAIVSIARGRRGVREDVARGARTRASWTSRRRETTR
jgi:hypothetical protein